MTVVKPIKLVLGAEIAKEFRARGIWIHSETLTQSQYSLQQVAQLCAISPAWLRIMFKEGRIDCTKNKRGHWVVAQEVVAAQWRTEVAKHTRQIAAKVEGKKYQYRRPTEWAYHLITKYIAAPGSKVTKADAKVVQKVMDNAKVAWEKSYQVKLAKKAAAEKESKE